MLWQKLLVDNPDDKHIVLGAANFYCKKDLERAKQILDDVLDRDPDQAEIWLERGRYTSDPKDRLRFLQKARQLGVTQPNLLVWISSAAAACGDYHTAEAIGHELLVLVAEARAKYDEKLDWEETGNAIWVKALGATGDRRAASELVRAISTHAYHKHWGHTALGHVALHRNDLRNALYHLKASASVVSDCRLSSYGPSFTLARELCLRGHWSEVAAYLQACESFWDDEKLPIWRALIESEKLPDF